MFDDARHRPVECGAFASGVVRAAVPALPDRPGSSAAAACAAPSGSASAAPVGVGVASTREEDAASSAAADSLVVRAGGSAGVAVVASAMLPAVPAVRAMAAMALAIMIDVVTRTVDLRGRSSGSGAGCTDDRKAARAADSPRNSVAVAGADAAARSWGSGDGPSPPSSSRWAVVPDSRPSRRVCIS